MEESFTKQLEDLLGSNFIDCSFSGDDNLLTSDANDLELATADTLSPTKTFSTTNRTEYEEA